MKIYRNAFLLVTVLMGVYGVGYAQKIKVPGAQLTRHVTQKAAKAYGYHPVFGHNQITCAIPSMPGAQIRLPLRKEYTYLYSHWENTDYAPMCGLVSAYDTYSKYNVSVLLSRYVHSPQVRRLVQVAPILRNGEQVEHSGAFQEAEHLTPTKLAEAVYLWRLVHPDYSIGDNGYLSQVLAPVAAFLQTPSAALQNQPAHTLLQAFLDDDFVVKSYAQMLEDTPQYPRYVTLTLHGLPVPTAQAAQARVLDAYLMLSNPREMGLFHNVPEGYEPFVLTPEEHAAADKLLALRSKQDRLPANPSVREVLLVAYNRLEAHTLSYRLAGQVENLRVYPNYARTALYRTVQGMLRTYSQTPVEELSEDQLHLLVLDGVMGGVTDESQRARVQAGLERLRTLWRHEPQALQHLRYLEQALP